MNEVDALERFLTILMGGCLGAIPALSILAFMEWKEKIELDKYLSGDK